MITGVKNEPVLVAVLTSTARVMDQYWSVCATSTDCLRDQYCFTSACY